MVYVWTDFGGVLTPPISASMSTFCDRYGITVAELRGALRALARRHNTDDAMALIDTGTVTEQSWLRELSELLDDAFALDTLADVWFENRAPNQEWIEHLRSLRARGAGVGLISNMVPTWDEHWRRMLGGTDLFDHVVLSFEIGHRKPDHHIFEYAAQVAGAAAAGRSPWPDALVGSMTHTRGFRAAAIGDRARYVAIGIDAELAVPLSEVALEAVRHPDDVSTVMHPLWSTILFSAKEAAFKAWSSAGAGVRHPLEIAISLDVSGRFRAMLPSLTPGGGRLSGRWGNHHEHVATAVVIRADCRW